MGACPGSYVRRFDGSNAIHFQAENYDLSGERLAMPADVFLSTNEADQDTTGKAGDASALPPVIQVSGGGEIHVGPQVNMKTSGGPLSVKKGSKIAVSQFAKLITE